MANVATLNLANYDLLDLIDEIELDTREESPELFQKSKYYDTDELVNTLRIKNDKFSLMTLNCQSLNSKFDELKLQIELLNRTNCSFTAICLQETWLLDDADLSLFQLPGYNLISKGYVSTAHGGVAIYLKKDLNYKVLPVSSPTSTWDCLFIEIDINKFTQNTTQSLILGNIYRPPRNTLADYTNFYNEMEEILQNYNNKGNVLLSGDFNIDLLKIQERPIYHKFLEVLISNSYIPKLTIPTRLAENSKTLIDNIAVKLTDNLSLTTSGAIRSNISDHLPCFTILDYLSLTHSAPKKIIINTQTAQNIESLRLELLQNCELNNFDVRENADPNINYNKLLQIMESALNSHIPKKEVRFNKHKHKKTPWITRGLINSIKFRDKLYSRLKATSVTDPLHVTLKNNLCTYNKILKKNIRLAKKSYFETCFNKYKKDMKGTWSTIKSILNKHSVESKFPDKFVIDGTSISNPNEIANSFNQYFTNIGPELASQITQPGEITFMNYLTDPTNEIFHFQMVSTADVIKVIDKLKNKTSCGLDNISNRLLKTVKTEICQVLTLIINQSFMSGIFPDQLKVAKVLPLYKKGESDLINNYRPISILSSLSKVFERIMHNQLTEHFRNANLFYESQYGFRTSHSTELAALELMNRNILAMDQNKKPINIFMDLSKAFDTLDHPILMEKLKYYGIQGTALKLFESYLSNRRQLIDFDTNFSDELPIQMGVPQGSILGPLLFIIYMNDFHQSTTKFKPIIYADDTTLVASLDAFNCTGELINTEVNKVTSWLSANKLSLNVNKTKAMVFSPTQRNFIKPDIKINDTVLEYVDSFNYLGIIFDKNLSWKNHIDHIIKKISKTIGIMKRLKHVLPKNILLTLYNTLIMPHLTYGILCWNSKHARLLTCQKKAVRLINCAKYNAHTDPIFKELKLLKLKDLCNLSILKLYFKMENKFLPQYFHNLIRGPPRGRQSRRGQLYFIPRVNHIYAKNSINYFLPVAINGIETAVTNKVHTHSYQGFINYAKLKFLDSYRVACLIPDCHICGNM